MDREELKKKIVEVVKEHGPINHYSLLAELNKTGIMVGYATIRKYVMELASEGKLRVYYNKTNGRREKMVEVV